MQSSTIQMVEKKVLEMAQHASFHQHVSYNLSTILHALTAGKTDPAQIAAAFSRAKGLEVITRVISGKPVPRPTVVGLCCGVARRVMDKIGTGVTEEQARGIVEALVLRLDLGITGDDAQTVECQVECARLLSSVAARSATTLLSGGALGAVEALLERLAGKNRSGSNALPSDQSFPGCSTCKDDMISKPRRRSRPSQHVRAPSIPFLGTGTDLPLLDHGGEEQRSILQPCCEVLERVSRMSEGRAILEARGTAGTLLSTIKRCPEALNEGSDLALAQALKVVERMFTGKAPEKCARSLVRDGPDPPGEEDSKAPPDGSPVSARVTPVECVEILLTVAGTAPDAVGSAASTCLWWISGASPDVATRALRGFVRASAASNGAVEVPEECFPEDETANDWVWFLLTSNESTPEEGAPMMPRRLLEAGRFLAALCLCKPGLKAVEAAVDATSADAIQALVKGCGASDPRLACSSMRILERLASGDLGARKFIDAGVLKVAGEAAVRFEKAHDDDDLIGDDEAYALAAALGTIKALAGPAGKKAHDVVEDAFRLAVRCLDGVADLGGRPGAAAAKAALDLITFRLTRTDRPHGRRTGIDGVIPPLNKSDSIGSTDRVFKKGHSREGLESWGEAMDGEDVPMEVLKDGSGILGVMRAHPSDARVQESGWRSLIAMDTGRGDVEKFFAGGDGHERRREMLKDCIERHGGDSEVAGRVAAMLERLVLSGDSDEEQTSLASTPTEEGADGEQVAGFNREIESAEPDSGEQSNGVGNQEGNGPEPPPPEDENRDEDDEGGKGVESENSEDTEPVGEACTEDLVWEANGVSDDAADETLVSVESTTVVAGKGGDGVEASEARSASGSLEVSSAATEERVEEETEEASGEEEDVALQLVAAAAVGPSPESPEDAFQRLTSVGQSALVSEDDSSEGGIHEAAEAATAESLTRSLFNDGDSGEDVLSGEGVKENEEAYEVPAHEVPPPRALETEADLRKSWEELEKLHSDVTGRSQILGGDNAELVASMPDPAALREQVESAMKGPGGKPSREGVAQSHLAMIGALTAATGALASSQKEVQRYLTMSRDLRDTSTWKDMSAAMQWTMDSLKGTVILFAPHTSHSLTKDLGICKNSEAASKLFKEAALNIKIVVLELAGEHAPNTVWRIEQAKFEALPINRKLMMLRHLRSLVVAYDHLNDFNRKDFTTALEIIKNREVLNKMGKTCVEAEALEEQRREARLASNEERLRVGRRSGRSSSVSKRSQSPATRPPTDHNSRTSPNPSNSGSRLSYPVASPTGAYSPSSSQAASPADKVLNRTRSGRSMASSDGGGSTAEGPGSGSMTRGIAAKPRRRDAMTASPASAPSRYSRSPVPNTFRVRPRSRSPARPSVNSRGRSKSPVPRARSRSPALGRSPSPAPQVPLSGSPGSRSRALYR